MSKVIERVKVEQSSELLSNTRLSNTQVKGEERRFGFLPLSGGVMSMPHELKMAIERVLGEARIRPEDTLIVDPPDEMIDVNLIDCDAINHLREVYESVKERL